MEISDISSDSFQSEEEVPELEGITEANEEDEFSSIRGGSRSRNASQKREKEKSRSKFKPPSLSETENEDSQGELRSDNKGEIKSKKVNNSFDAGEFNQNKKNNSQSQNNEEDIKDISEMMVYDSRVILNISFYYFLYLYVSFLFC